LDEHGLRSGERGAQARLRELAGGRGNDEGREAERPFHALPSRAPRRGSGRRSDRRPAERSLGRSRESAAHAEGVDGIPCARESEEGWGEEVKGKVNRV